MGFPFNANMRVALYIQGEGDQNVSYYRSHDAN